MLGVSRVETVSSTTVQIFTGNAIGPRGDMTSRSLMLALNVDRPDPENRAFVHPDPLAWTRAHRRHIVRALYVLLLAGALNRPPNQEAKTRFKSWWTLVGWPMEYAAGLVGINPALEEAAINLGCTRVKAFYKVALPLIRSSLVSGLIFAFILSFSDINIAIFLSGPHTNPLPLQIFSDIQWQGDPTIAAASAIQIVVVTSLIVLAHRLSRKRLVF